MATNVTVENNDLYITGYVIDFPETGESLLLRDRLEFLGDEEDEYHLFVQGDRLDLLAFKYYKNVPNIRNPSKLWFLIAEANNVINPFDMDSFVGTELLIPNYEKFKLKINGKLSI